MRWPAASASDRGTEPVTYLDRIVERHRQAAAADDRNLDDLLAAARRLGATRGFAVALAGHLRDAIGF